MIVLPLLPTFIRRLPPVFFLRLVRSVRVLLQLLLILIPPTTLTHVRICPGYRLWQNWHVCVCPGYRLRRTWPDCRRC